jgi:hypothetical protein
MSDTTNIIRTIDVAFPVAGQDNDSEGFRTNFNKIRQSLLLIENTVTQIKSAIDLAGGSSYFTATHINVTQDLEIGNNSFFSIDTNQNLEVASHGNIVLKPSTGFTVITKGAYSLTDSITNSSTGTFAVDSVANIEIGATITFPNISGVYTVTRIDGGSNLITVTPPIPDSPIPFNVGDNLVFHNPFTSSGNSSFIVYGDILATGNITGYGSPSDARLKENITTITNALTLIDGLRGVYYDWTDDYLENFVGNVFVPKHDTGVIAQEVQEVLPEVVFMKPNGDLGVRYEKIVGVLIQAIKELKTEVASLRTQINGQ